MEECLGDLLPSTLFLFLFSEFEEFDLRFIWLGKKEDSRSDMESADSQIKEQLVKKNVSQFSPREITHS